MTKTKYSEKFYQTNIDASSSSARVILEEFLKIYRAESLLDVGCGIGTWGRAAKRLGVRQYHGVDGNYISCDQLLIEKDEFTAHDLRQPLCLEKRFDAAICMEVGEHLPPDSARELVASLCRHSLVIVFSAAIPEQGGVNHINEQWQSYWAKLFELEGYGVVDCIRPRIWNDMTVAEYYKQNVLVYIDRSEAKLVSLFTANATTQTGILDMVHPVSYQIKADPLRWPLLKVIRKFPAICLRSIRNRVFSP